ncbi:MAG TPA: LysE family transporter [Candidatus Kapabacteria bacterium]|nr:LysE family transporter [Candidatus Kapabacteria bacterium]
MIGALFAGLVVGFFLSIPPGPIAVAVMRQALEGKYRPGLELGLGAATMDTLYSLFAIFASSAFVESLKAMITGNGWMLLAFQVVCIATLVILGMRYFKATAVKAARSEEKELKQEERARRMGYTSPYVVGIIMSITNLASPTFIPSILTVAGFMHANNFVDQSFVSSAFYAVGFGTGAASWFMVVLRSVYRFRDRLSTGFITRLYQFAGWSFMLFAVILAVNIVIHTKWSAL